jgi:hypothetical protein
MNIESIKDVQPTHLTEILEYIRNRNTAILQEEAARRIAAENGQKPIETPKIGASARLEPFIEMRAYTSELWDLLSRVEEGKQFRAPWVGASEKFIYGPYMTDPVPLFNVATTNHLTVLSPDNGYSKNLASYLWYLDSPKYDISLMEVDVAELPMSPSTSPAQYIREYYRNLRALDLIRLYRWQATLFELATQWDTVKRVGMIAKKYGLPLADEIDAADALVNDLLKLRHPLCVYCADSFRNMRAQTPDGPAKVYGVTEGVARLLKSNAPNGWHDLMNAISNVTEKALESGELPKKEPRHNVFLWLQKVRPIMELRGEAMIKMASKLWSGSAGIEQMELLFNRPPFAMTDGISAGVNASEVLLGLRQLVPITSTALRFDIARDEWDWLNYSPIVIDKEEAPGEYIRPSDGLPTDILPASLYMGEPGAVKQPSSSILRRLEQFRMLEQASRLVSVFGNWPSDPGDYGFNGGDAQSVARAKEEIGYYVTGKLADMAKVITNTISASTRDSISASHYYVRPDGFAARSVVRRTHPSNYYYMHGDILDTREMGTYWYSDWPVSASDLSMPRPLSTAVTAKVMACFPGL